MYAGQKIPKLGWSNGFSISPRLTVFLGSCAIFSPFYLIGNVSDLHRFAAICVLSPIQYLIFTRASSVSRAIVPSSLIALYIVLFAYRSFVYFAIFSGDEAIFGFVVESLKYLIAGILIVVGYCLETLKSNKLNRQVWRALFVTSCFSVVVSLAQAFGILQASESYGLLRPSGLSTEPRFYAASILPFIILLCVQAKNSFFYWLRSFLYIIPAGYTLWLASSTYVIPNLLLLFVSRHIYRIYKVFIDFFLASKIKRSAASAMFLTLLALLVLYAFFVINNTFDLASALRIRQIYSDLLLNIFSSSSLDDLAFAMLYDKSSLLDDQIKLPLLALLSDHWVMVFGTGFSPALTDISRKYLQYAFWIKEDMPLYASFNLLQLIVDFGLSGCLFITAIFLRICTRISFTLSSLISVVSPYSRLSLLFFMFTVSGFFLYANSSFPFYIAFGWLLSMNSKICYPLYSQSQHKQGFTSAAPLI